MKIKQCKKFNEYVEAYKAVSAANNQAEKWWINKGKHYPEMKEYPAFKWNDEVHKAEFNHGVFIKLVGSKFDEGEESISKFTFLLYEYFIANDEGLEYQEIKDRWGHLMDFKALKLSKGIK